MRRAAVAAALTTSLLVTTLVTGDVVAAPGPGSDGAGDAYFPKYGNGGYDVGEYAISVRFNPNTERLNGKTIIMMRATRDLSSFNLDLVLPASRVTVNGASASFRSGAHELHVVPDGPLRRGQTARVAVTYAGIPQDITYNGVSPWITTPDGALALGQPEIAVWWFPSNDHPTDKARYRIQVKVPVGKEAISGGTFKGRSTRAGWTTWKWELGSQTASYLVFAAIGDYDIERGVAPSGRKFFHAYGPDVGANARNSIRFTDAATTFLAERLGPYPFAQIGGVVPSGAGFGFALETQTRPVYTRGFFDNGLNASVVIHEMAHQWFGDSVSVHRWKNIWLNEGFATYMEWLWEHTQGAPLPANRLALLYGGIPASDPFWDLKIGDPGAARLFDGAVYDRGAMTAQALRNRVGSGVFFRIVRTWLRTHRDGTGTTKQFKALAERLSGEQLDGFFDAWLFTGAKPADTPANGL